MKEPVIVHTSVRDKVRLEDKYEYTANLTIGLADGGDYKHSSMKHVLYLLLVFGIAGCNSSGSSSPPTAESHDTVRQYSQPAASYERLIDSLKPYCYRIYTDTPSRKVLNRTVMQGTGFFVRHNKNLYFITAKHIFFKGLSNEWQSKIFSIEVTHSSGLPIFMIVDLSKPPLQVYLYSFGEQGDADIAAVRIPNVPPNTTINVIDHLRDVVKNENILKGDTVCAFGYPVNFQRKLLTITSVLTTNVLYTESLKRPFIYSRDTLRRGMSGGPAFLLKTQNNITHAQLVGICSGWDGQGEFANNGRYFHSGIIEALLNKADPK